MLKKIVLASLFVLPFGGMSQSFYSDTTRLSEVLISENRLQIPFNKTARNLQVVTREDIQQLSVKSINEV
jgi:iron complex outermembrane receptor protein